MLGWGGYGLSYYLAVLVPFHSAGPPQIIADFAYCFAGFLSTHVLRMRIRRGGWAELPYAKMLPRLAAGSLLAGLVLTAVLDGTLALEGQLTREEWHSNTTFGIIGATVFSSAFLVALWFAIYLGVHGARRRRALELDALRAEVLAREAKLRSLQQQLNPHFLFNCLNSLRGMIDEDQDRAREMVTRLAELLRASLRQDECVSIPLDEELATVNAYLELESVRLEERLRIQREIDPAASSSLIPPMLLQGLVENALKHGISKLPGGGDLALRIARRGEKLHIEVENTGTLAPAQRTGIGLANARERLRLLYGSAAQLMLAECSPGNVRATVVLPFQQEAACEPSS
jgi:LytS/YehU family sensor histidine kinase